MENNFYAKRLPRELEYIEKNMPMYSFYKSYFDPTQNANRLELTTPNGNNLTFIIPSNYPFKPPTRVELNGQNYRQLISQMSRRIHYLYNYSTDAYFEEKVHGPSSSTCICCTGLLCPTNWTPCIMIHHILKEIGDHNQLKQMIAYKLTLRDIFDNKQIPLELIRFVLAYLL